MDKKEFNKILRSYLISKGFEKKGKYFIKEAENVACVIGIQKSSYSESYYVNVGYIIKELNKSITAFRDVDGDIRARFSYQSTDKRIDLLELENITNNSQLLQMFDENADLIEAKMSINGLKEIINKRPSILYQTKINAKTFLGYE